MSVITFNPRDLNNILSNGIYSIFNNIKKLFFFTNTLYNNYGAQYIINNYILLFLNSYYKLALNNYIFIGIITFLISARSKRVIKKVLNGIRGEATADFILKDIAFIKGFYLNIIFKEKFYSLSI